MKRAMVGLIGGAVLSGVAAVAASGQNESAREIKATTADIQLWRLDCGAIRVNDLNEFSDIYAYTGRTKQLTSSCYLIRHGATYMIWDTGLPVSLKGKPTNGTDALSATLSVTIAEQLAKLNVKPEQVTTVGISHYHFDHVGQASMFPAARLLIGNEDLKVLRDPPEGVDAAPLAGWLKEGGNVEGVQGDKDVFGDGSVQMIDLPGHTPGHHGLLVRLKNKGMVLLSGDVAHFNENLANEGVPPFNSDRAQTLASLQRFKAIAANLGATLIIQHEPEDITKLPVFPAAAD